MRGYEFRRGLGRAALAGMLAGVLAGCDGKSPPPAEPAAGPTGTVAPSGVTATASPTPARPSGTPSATPRRTGTGTGAVGEPTRPSPRPPVRTPKRPASHDPTEDITDLVPTTTGLRLNRPVAGVRHGELVVRIRNNGPEPVWKLTFTVEVPESMSADGGDWAGCSRLQSRRAGFPAGAECGKGYLGPGESRVFRLGMKSPAAKDGSDSLISRWLVDVWSAGDRSEYCRDRRPDDNRKMFNVYRA